MSGSKKEKTVAFYPGKKTQLPSHVAKVLNAYARDTQSTKRGALEDLYQLAQCILGSVVACASTAIAFPSAGEALLRVYCSDHAAEGACKKGALKLQSIQNIDINLCKRPYPGILQRSELHFIPGILGIERG
jgi:hypothetical protein